MSDDLSFEALRQCGFAPGSYVCFCSDCGKQHTADKRAWRCMECAEERAGIIEAAREQGRCEGLEWAEDIADSILNTGGDALQIRDAIYNEMDASKAKLSLAEFHEKGGKTMEQIGKEIGND